VGRSSRVLATLLATALPGSATAEGLYLYAIPTTGRARAAGADAPLRIRAFVADPAALAAALSPGVREVAADHVAIDASSYPELEPRDPERYRTASFLIDFDEPEVRALSAELAARHGGAPSLEELRRFAGGAIPRKSSERGWDAASRIARAGVGDCTEHAVLLTALARAAGRPARVALGLLVARVDGEPLALGHAWAEIHDGGRWVPVDATPAADEAAVLGYAPLMLLADEGPGYVLAIARQLQRGWVRRVEVE
jgi:transglutaminase-like putative cysteine protease